MGKLFLRSLGSIKIIVTYAASTKFLLVRVKRIVQKNRVLSSPGMLIFGGTNLSDANRGSPKRKR